MEVTAARHYLLQKPRQHRSVEGPPAMHPESRQRLRAHRLYNPRSLYWVKRLGREADYSPPSSAIDKCMEL
jgi:hypothetical protein